MRRKSSAKIVAVFALLGIIISIIGTGLLIFFSGNSSENQTLSPEQLQELINKSNTGAEVEVGTGVEAEINTGVIIEE